MGAAILSLVRYRVSTGALLLVLLCMTFLSAAAAVFTTPASAAALRINRAGVTQRLVLLGYERQEAAKAVEALTPDRLAKLAGSLGQPSAGFVLLTVLCLVFSVSAFWFILLIL